MTSYTAEDLRVFDTMPDTATKAEIREAIEKERAAREIRSALRRTAEGWRRGFKNPAPFPDDWGPEHERVVEAAMHWLIATTFPKVE